MEDDPFLLGPGLFSGAMLVSGSNLHVFLGHFPFFYGWDSQFHPLFRWNTPPWKNDEWRWIIHREWRCISYWKWGCSNVMLVFRAVFHSGFFGDSIQFYGCILLRSWKWFFGFNHPKISRNHQKNPHPVSFFNVFGRKKYWGGRGKKKSAVCKPGDFSCEKYFSDEFFPHLTWPVCWPKKSGRVGGGGAGWSPTVAVIQRKYHTPVPCAGCQKKAV